MGKREDYIPLVEAYERKVDKVISEHALISLCAYDNSSTPLEIMNNLMLCYDVLITDKEYKFLQN
ncbi:MEDS domain-containing protein [Cytobacillus firmus]|uniref:MEDS domain-containing protein n=1 Tax=Cytobacillus firmus TaxID=1399 RepID=UPI00222812B4|nr:MEDS domain-containing protein [Cytobacillus firmus]